MQVQAVGHRVALEDLQDRPAVHGIVVCQPEDREHGRSDIRVVRPDIGRLAQLSDPRSNQAQPGGGDLWLDVAVVPGVEGHDAGEAGARRVVGQVVVGVTEEGETGVPIGIAAGVHVEELHLRLIGHRHHQAVCVRRVRVDRRQAGRVTLELAIERIGLGELPATGTLPGQVEGWCVIAVDGEPVGGRAAQELRREGRELLLDEAVDVGVDLADLTGPVARRRHAVAVGGGRRAADEVISLVDREHEQGIRAVDAVARETGEERAERVVIGLELGDIAGRTGTVGEMRVAGRAMKIVGVGDVGKGDRHAPFLHRRRVGQRGGRGHAIEAREAGIAVWVGDRLAVQSAERRAGRLAGQQWINLLGAKQALEVRVAARLGGQRVGLTTRAGRRTSGAVDGQTDEVRLRPRLRAGICGRIGQQARRLRFGPLRRRLPEDLGDVAVGTSAGVLQDGVRGGNGAKVTAGPGVRHPRCRSVQAGRRDHVRDGRRIRGRHRIRPVAERADEREGASR